MKIKPLRKDLTEYLKSHNLMKKWDKVSALFQRNIKHPSLNTELLQPHARGIYSFRIKKNSGLYFLLQVMKLKYFRLQIIIRNSFLHLIWTFKHDVYFNNFASPQTWFRNQNRNELPCRKQRSNCISLFQKINGNRG